MESGERKGLLKDCEKNMEAFKIKDNLSLVSAVYVASRELTSNDACFSLYHDLFSKLQTVKLILKYNCFPLTLPCETQDQIN